jgi:hypothetical protein
LGELDIEGRLILTWLLKKQDMRALSGHFWLRIETSGGL